MLKIQITNTSQRSVLFRLEPWGDEKEIRSEESVTIQGVGPEDGLLEIEQSDNVLTLHGWEGSILEIQDDSKPSE